MLCAIQTLLCGDTSSGINTAISAEVLKIHCISSVHLAFKLSDPREMTGGAMMGLGAEIEGVFLFPTLLHTLLLINSSLQLVRDREGVSHFLDTRYSQEAVKSCRLPPTPCLLGCQVVL